MDRSDASNDIEGLDVAVFEPGSSYSASSKGPPSTAQKSPRLLDRLRAEICLRHYSLRTEEAYVGWVRRFNYFHGNRHPKDMGVKEFTKLLP